ncbi:phosphoribosylaminoimidazolesuccinocarboxamide synthase [bacterium]|nr:phosphoribosylaminoimidazolesuccinocarboxamide synthase [bacterium]MBU1984457.1 phosphoribosylaminoimidazolesuccinocarboxamide synthase [bacterium]
MSTVSQTHLDLKLLARGKVRDIYELDRDHLVIVTSDRLSAFDVVLPDPIPGKGAVLTRLTRFWMDKLARIVPNHLPLDRSKYDAMKKDLAAQEPGLTPDHIEIVRKAKVFPVECVVRGYITGSGWKDYQKTGEVCGYRLPAGLRQCDRLPEPLFTPSTKATVGHDENITVEQAANIIGKAEATRLAEASLALYKAGAEWAEQRGIIMADTKFEFGLIDGQVHVVDEVLTPDSSRFWPMDKYEPGRDQPSFDKQIVRNHLLDIGWNKTPPAPALPPEIITKTSQAYREILNLLTS